MQHATTDRQLGGYSPEIRTIILSGIQRAARKRTQRLAERLERDFGHLGVNVSAPVRNAGSLPSGRKDRQAHMDAVCDRIEADLASYPAGPDDDDFEDY